MFGMGLSEIITLTIVCLVLINPRELPAIMKKIGRIYASIMREINGVRKTFNDFENEVDSVKNIGSDIIKENKK